VSRLQQFVVGKLQPREEEGSPFGARRSASNAEEKVSSYIPYYYEAPTPPSDLLDSISKMNKKII
jgi:hypothetical protein